MDYFEVSNKEKIESQLFGSTVTEEEIVNELSQKLDEMPSTESLSSSVATETLDVSDKSVSEVTEDSDQKKEEPLEIKKVIEDLGEIKSE